MDFESPLAVGAPPLLLEILLGQAPLERLPAGIDRAFSCLRILLYITTVPIQIALKAIQLKRRLANAVMLSRVNHQLCSLAESL